MSLQPFLKAKIQRLRITTIETKFELSFDGALVIGPRLAWAAGLSEFEQVELHNLVRCEKTSLHVMFGAEGGVEVWTSGPQRMQVGDTVRVVAMAWLSSQEISDHATTLVLAGKKNAPIEIRRIKARRALIDPSFIPIPPREEITIHRVRESTPV